MSRRKKYIYTPFKKHFWIPFGLSLLIIVAGVIMLLTDQQEIGTIHRTRNRSQTIYVTGPSTIALGTGLCIVLLSIRKWFK